MRKILNSPKYGFLISLSVSLALSIGFQSKLGSLGASLLCPLFFGLVWFSYLLILPFYQGKDRVRRISIGIVLPLATMGTTLLTLIVRSTFGEELLKELEKYIKLGEAPGISSLGLATILIAFVAFVILLLLNIALRDTSVMGKAGSRFEEFFPERDFREKLRDFVSYLSKQLETLDRETSWTDSHFTPLDAEVEVRSGSKRKKRITSLLKALRTNRKSKTFLVLGAPGAGKSVALRKLCRELLMESKETSKVAIYVNLKEWSADSKWTEECPPTYAEFIDFVLNSIKGKDIHIDDFVDKYLMRLIENGFVFWVLDSFDEIPAVLDEPNEASWLIAKLSEIMDYFLGGANKSRGVLASRFYRKPTVEFEANTLLEIRPFSEYQVANALKRYLGLDKAKIRSIFKDRQDLVSIASNPFSAGLIYHYWKKEANLPSNQSDLYDNYIRGRILAASKILREKNVDEAIVIQGAIEIANFMFDKPQRGLEATVEELVSAFPSIPIKAIVEVLKYCRIGRIGTGGLDKFSFVHRRFNEYFVIQKFRTNPDLIKLSSIPEDSKYRDALALYCEIAEAETAKRIAKFCWKEIKKLENRSFNSDNPQYLRSIHCLRFLCDAFINRKNCLNSFINRLASLIEKELSKPTDSIDPLLTKVSIEAACLLSQKRRYNIILRSFSFSDEWVRSASIKACRLLEKLPNEIEIKILAYLDQENTFKLIKSYKEITFSLDLSPAFHRTKRGFLFLTAQRILGIIGLAISISCYPASTFLSAAILIVFTTLSKQFDTLPSGFIELVYRFSLSIFPIFFCIIPSLSTIYYDTYNPSIFYETAMIPRNILLDIFIFSSLIPILPIYILTNIVRKTTNRKNIYKIASISIIVVATIGILMWLINMYPGLRFLTLIPATFVIIPLPLRILKIVRQLRADRRKIAKFISENRKKVIYREKVFEMIEQLDTESGLIQFIEVLSNDYKSCSGQWPNGKIPQSKIKGSRIQFKIAKIEEKWLGLER